LPDGPLRPATTTDFSESKTSLPQLLQVRSYLHETHLRNSNRINVQAEGPLYRDWQERTQLLFLIELTVLMHALTEVVICLQCFDAVGWAAGRASSL